MQDEEDMVRTLWKHEEVGRTEMTDTLLQRRGNRIGAIINGNSATGAGLQFDGLDRIIQSNITDLAGNPLTLTAVTTTMRNIVTVGGKPQALILSFYDNQKFSELVMASYYRLFQAGAGAMADIPAGIAVSRWVSPFGTIDIIPTRFAPDAYSLRRAFIIDDKSLTEDGNAIAMVVRYDHVKPDCIGGTPNSKRRTTPREVVIDPVETTRRAPRGDDIVRSIRRRIELGRNDLAAAA